MKFNSVNVNVGFQNISSFIDTGMLVIEKSGLSMISVSVISNTDDANFYIYQNIQMQSNTRISDGSWNTGTHVITLQLHNGDKIWRKKLQQQDSERLQQETNKLRHDVDTNLALLTTQLQQKFDFLQKSLVDEGKLNETKQNMLLLQEKYQTLEHNYNRLQQEHSLLQTKFIAMENEMKRSNNRTDNCEKKVLDLESYHNATETRFRAQGEELYLMKNKSLQVEQEMAAFKQLPNIKPLIEINTLQNTVKSLTSQTNSLSMKEQARSQDFLALFNITVGTTKTLTELSTNVNNRLYDVWNNQTAAIAAIENNLTNQLQSFQTNQNKAIIRLENMVRAAESRANGTHDLLQRQINKSVEKVAMTAFVPVDTSRLSVGSVVKFSDVKFSIGIRTPSSFKNTGKFVCEKSGLYIVSASMEMNYDFSEFHIDVNSKVFTKNSKHNSDYWHSTSVSIAIELNTNDTVWIQISHTSANIRGDLHSRFTIIKIQ
ncbi:unnamed protein product [Mytilus coruscus]|uniref:C1q domain-containing protein n=1 Tax=Mytilus coruscus TaxID=42192 RepID=A0A6J8EPB1_MYTCO|nr:unnamed protein product [Mytilus coruscus]